MVSGEAAIFWSARAASVFGVLGASCETSSPTPGSDPRSGRFSVSESGSDMETGGLVCAVAMPPAPTAAMTPTPSTVELRASPPRCLATRCRPRTGRMDSSVGSHSSQALVLAGASPYSGIGRYRGAEGRLVGRHEGALLSFLLAYRVS